ncbi:hypothetical protein A9Q84_18300 [Halobacteriovorax marinus]|uniref:Sensor histidine kinase NatK-like C-terminal domain-containing protein n=1 Tax=Halobacteriovorax marinus TaxID=97084 RepID=A0A1Y5F9H8_9BACT|nr:hypothetical protein A9Q84_18300 [Halobacteriovorax marinus]
MVYFRKDLERTFQLLDLYLTQSFFLSFVLWIGLHSEGITNSLEFFSTTLLTISYLFYTSARGQLEKVTWSWQVPTLFVFQIFSFVGLSFSLKTTAPLFVGVIPCLAGMYYFQYQDGKTPERGESKSWALMAIALSCFFIFQGVEQTNSITYFDGIFLGIFSAWTLGTVYFGNELFLKERKSLFQRIRSGRQKVQETHVNKDRYFFHDIINQTHGLGLFLNSKVSDNQGLSSLDCSRVLAEVKLLQTLIKDHFGYNHKNIQEGHEYVNFEFAKMGLYTLIQNFLPGDDIQCHLIFKGDISESVSFNDRMRATVHYPTFYRVLNNLIKNISEENSKLIEFTFSYDEDGLSITVKNKILSLKESDSQLARELSEIILNNKVIPFKDRESGLGLESISSLVQEVSGTFRFSIEGEFWVSEIFLPRPAEETDSIAA